MCNFPHSILKRFDLCSAYLVCADRVLGRQGTKAPSQRIHRKLQHSSSAGCLVSAMLQRVGKLCMGTLTAHLRDKTYPSWMASRGELRANPAVTIVSSKSAPRGSINGGGLAKT